VQGYTAMEETETLDKIYLEWSQFTKARTGREIRLKNALVLLIEATHPIIRKPELTSDESALYDAVLKAKDAFKDLSSGITRR
jgi:hypothetical protein